MNGKTVRRRKIGGYIQLSNERDYPVLRQVLHAGFVTHTQLFELMRFAGLESCREAFNWRVKRLATHELLLRHQLPDYGRLQARCKIAATARCEIG